MTTAMSSPQPGPVLAYPLRDALYLNLTSSCSLSCVFCPKIRDRDFTVGGFDLLLRRDPTAEEVWTAVRAAGLEGRAEVVFTGLGEPTLRLEILLDLVRRLRGAGVGRIRLDTDGLASLREGRDVSAALAAAGLDAVSVSLNAPDAATYVRVCPSPYGAEAFDAVKEFIRSMVRSVPEVVASAVGFRGISEEACRRTAQSLGARFRWRPYHGVPVAGRPATPSAVTVSRHPRAPGAR